MVILCQKKNEALNEYRTTVSNFTREEIAEQRIIF